MIARLLLAALGLAGCLDSLPPDGVLCGVGPEPCPRGWSCAGDGRCYRPGAAPDLAVAAPVCTAQSDCADCGDGGAANIDVLAATWQGEERDYWAAPAATRLALSTRQTTPASQTAIAAYLGTVAGVTDPVDRVRAALNNFLASTWFMTKYVSDPPTAAELNTLKGDVLFNIPKGYPLVANVISGFRPACYPSGEPGVDFSHYVAIIGFDRGGDEVLIADPAAEGAGGAGFSAVPRTYWISVGDLAIWIGGAGYAA